MATYAIGDIQGCLGPFEHLIELTRFTPGVDRLWLVGDLVNRGPDSLGVLRLVHSLDDSAQVVLGNHDLHLLAVAHGVRNLKSSDTIASVLAAPDAADLLDWLRHRPLMHRDCALGYTMVHAGIPPMWSVEEALGHAAEVEAVLRGPGLVDFLTAMYGDEPDHWDPSLSGLARLRVITNYFTRMRHCTADGVVDLQDKTSTHSSRAGFAPWYSHPKRASRGERIIFGHWASLAGAADDPEVFALDTGCVWGNRLTALRLEDGEEFQCDCRHERTLAKE